MITKIDPSGTFNFAIIRNIIMSTCNVGDILHFFRMLYPSTDHCKCLPNSCISEIDYCGLMFSFFLRFHIRQY